MCRDDDIVQCLSRTVVAEWLRALIYVVPRSGAGDKSGRHCIGNFTIDMYCALLHKRQDKFPKLCWRFVFLNYHNNVSDTNAADGPMTVE